MELGGKAVFLGVEARGILAGPSRETPSAYILASPFSVQNAMAVYEDATKTQTSQR